MPRRGRPVERQRDRLDSCLLETRQGRRIEQRRRARRYRHPEAEGASGGDQAPQVRALERVPAGEHQVRLRVGERCELLEHSQALGGAQLVGMAQWHGFGWLAWLLPGIGLVVATGALALFARRWSRPSSTPSPPTSSVNGQPLDPETERRVDEELARFDG